MQFDEVLRTWKEFFEREGVRYALIGGLAVNSWGQARVTKDVDFAVDTSSRSRVVAFAESLGYETLYLSEGYSNHEHATSRLGRVDLMYLSGETAERIFRAITDRTIVADVAIPVANEALWRVRALNAMDPYEYLEFLVRFTKDLPPSGEIDAPWPEPFEL
jgi:hypothetical protein